MPVKHLIKETAAATELGTGSFGLLQIMGRQQFMRCLQFQAGLITPLGGEINSSNKGDCPRPVSELIYSSNRA